jgi:SAM-dependent methyltransferase
MWRSALQFINRKSDPVANPDPVADPSTRLLAEFVDRLRAISKANVLEIGTCRSNPEVATHHRDWASDDASFVMTDFQDGLDVDVVADLHSLSRSFSANHFDAVIACSVFEHVQRPWMAAPEIGKVLKPGGQVFIQTHQTFPLHGYPSDYWRFTREALETLFDEMSGFRVVQSGYEFPCRIVSQEAPGTATAIAYLNVSLVAEKLG